MYLRIGQKVLNNIYKEWAEDVLGSYESIRLLYRGRFLENDMTLDSQKVPVGHTTVKMFTI
jgi:hypothetical protein